MWPSTTTRPHSVPRVFTLGTRTVSVHFLPFPLLSGKDCSLTQILGYQEIRMEASRYQTWNVVGIYYPYCLDTKIPWELRTSLSLSLSLSHILTSASYLLSPSSYQSKPSNLSREFSWTNPSVRFRSHVTNLNDADAVQDYIVRPWVDILLPDSSSN